MDEAVKKFNRLARLCPELVSTERERVRLMLKMLRLDIALNVAGGINRPQTTEELISSALITEDYLNSIKQQKPVLIENKSQGSSGTQKPQSQGSTWKGSSKRK